MVENDFRNSRELILTPGSLARIVTKRISSLIFKLTETSFPFISKIVSGFGMF
jgi:hypothetical protein